MQFSTSYRQYNHYQQVDEIKFPISLLSNAITTASQYPQKRIVIHIPELNKSSVALDKLLQLLIETPNLYLELYDISDVVNLSAQLLTRKCTDKKIFYHHAATTFNLIYFLLKHNVSDVVIGEPIVFDLPNVRKMVPQNSGIILRVNPIQGRPPLYNSIRNEDDGLCHFWAIPQSIPFYQNYIDLFDLTDNNEERESTLLTVFLRGEYIHSLSSLCVNVDNSVPCAAFTPEDLQYRTICKQKCIMNSCHRCRIITDTYFKLKEKNI